MDTDDKFFGWIVLALLALGVMAYFCPEGVEYGVKLFLFNEGMGPLPILE